MNLNSLSRDEVQFDKQQVLSLQTSCFSCIVEHLDEFSTEHLSLLPTRIRRQLFTYLPPLDILKLEGTSVVSGLDMNEVWHVISEQYHDIKCYPITTSFKYREDITRRLMVNLLKEVMGDWRSIFLTKTWYYLLHTFNPSSIGKVAHTADCEQGKRNPIGLFCGCWGKGIDRLHHDIFWRLIAIQYHSELARNYSLLEEHQGPRFTVVKYYDKYPHSSFSQKLFRPSFVIPNRLASYLAVDNKNAPLDLLTDLLKECRHVKPKVLTINCGFMQYSNLYQHFQCGVNDIQSHNQLLADLLSEVECLEFYWPSMSQWADFDVDSSLRVPMTVLGAIFANSTPKLTSLKVLTSKFPKFNDCWPNIAPFFSAQHYTKFKNKSLPIMTPYAGLKNVHIYAREVTQECAQHISAMILHQSSVKDVKISFPNCSVNPDVVLDLHLLLDLIQSIQRQLQFFVFEMSWKDTSHSLESIFQQFLKTYYGEIFTVVNDHGAVIPANSPSVSKRRFEIKLYNIERNDFSGIVFSWLQQANVTEPLKFIKTNGKINSTHLKAMRHYLSTCEALEWTCNTEDSSILQTQFRTVSNPNLQFVDFYGYHCIVYNNLLPALFASSPLLEKLRIMRVKSSYVYDKVETVFEHIVMCPYPEQLTVDLSLDGRLTQTDVDKLLQVWRRRGQGRKLKAVLLGRHLQPLTEMVLHIDHQ